MAERHRVIPAARLVTSEMPKTSMPGVPAGDGLECRGHAHQVAADPLAYCISAGVS